VKKSGIRASPQDLLAIFPFLLFVLAGLSAVYPRFSVFFDSAMRHGVRRKAIFT
jgi:hypothetical protein